MEGGYQTINTQPCAVVPFELGVSDHSKAYVPLSREIVAQFDVRKAMILLDNSGFRIPYFEPGGRRFESVRARIKSIAAIEHLALSNIQDCVLAQRR